MLVYRAEITVDADGSLLLDRLPFAAGEEVTVTVEAREPDTEQQEQAFWREASRPTLQGVWDNADDAIYDTLPVRSDWQSFGNALGIIRLVLLVEWDPIGIFGYAGAMDEYDSYAPGVLALLQTSPTVEQVAKHLWGVQTTEIGIGRGEERCSAAAKKLLMGFANAMDAFIV